MSTLWDDIAKTVRDGVDTVVSKTEELTKIGKIKIEIITIKRNIEKQFAELGGTVYHLIDEKKASITSNADVKKIVEKVKKLEQQLNAKNEELEKVKVKVKVKVKAKAKAKAKEENSAADALVEVEEVKESGKSKETEPAA